MNKALTRTLMTIGVMVWLLIGWKYYQFSTSDQTMSDTCLFSENVNPGRGVDRQAYCDCFGAQMKKNIGFVNYTIVDKEKLIKIMENSFSQCKIAHGVSVNI